MYLNNEFITNILNDINTLSCPSKNNSNTIELAVQSSCYWGLRLTLCYCCFCVVSLAWVSEMKNFPVKNYPL